ncbi:MAG: sulfite exporter TauE/SafE family protein [Pseudomonadaceae bacterium]|nr:sulfite exporter TauE/SafE family protein [Pseudomonadaceae bacterium]
MSIGLTSGFLGGLLGIGGGVVIVPALIALFAGYQMFPPAEAILVALATSLTAIVFTSVSAARAQFRAGKVRMDIVQVWAVFVALGAVLSGQIASQLGLTTLRGFIGGFLLFVAIVMLTQWKPGAHRTLPGRLASSVIATIAGVVSGLAGIGGGNVIVPTLVYNNVPVHEATATSSALGVGLALAGALGFLLAGLDWATSNPGYSGMAGYIHVPSAFAIIVAAVMTAPLGVALAHRIAPLPLRRAFGALLLFVSARMLYLAFTTS